MYSMTGYGKGVAKADGKTITVEIKTVNHRYLDFGIKIPRSFLFLEDAIKKAVSGAISRGHVDLFLTYEQSTSADGAYTADVELAKNYLAVAKDLAKQTGIKNDITLSSLVKVADVIKREQPTEDEELLKKLTEEALSIALENLKVMRKREGASLMADISSKLDCIEKSLAIIKQNAPKVVENYRAGLQARIAEVVDANKIDMQRLATEVALYADHCAIDEEITRLGAHIAHARALLLADEPVGRKTEFLVQEFNRETNTIGSKANDLAITSEVLKIKNEIEKIREQAANIE
ncbi:MAG: YicC family protein [Bacteroides sp.]|nr:YicC family protein [Bacillota bacterium]MCM1455382.1 YicC family protein [Bacteroides sp.]